jgi:hypothetical protein
MNGELAFSHAKMPGVIQFFNIKIQFIDITKHGTNNKI